MLLLRVAYRIPTTKVRDTPWNITRVQAINLENLFFEVTWSP